MNASFMLEGVLFATGVVLLARLISGRTRRVAIALALAHGIGMVLVGLFHGSPGGRSADLVVHIVAAAVGILCANILAIMAGSVRSLALPAAYLAFSIAVGVVGILSEALVSVSVSAAGLFERGGVYSWLLWGFVTGALVLVRQMRRVAVVETVPA